jgi:hypothetical protein
MMDVYYAESMDLEESNTTEAHPKASSMDYDITNMQQHEDTTSNSQNVTQYVSKVQQAGKYLSQIVHTNECRGHCSNECMTRFRLINHSISCNFGGSCVIAGCNTTRQLIRHRENCYQEEQAARSLGIEKRECLICTIAYKYIGGTYCEPSLTLTKPKPSSPLSTTPNTVTSFVSPASSRRQRMSAPDLVPAREYAQSYSSTSQGASLLHAAQADDRHRPTRHFSADDSKGDHEFAIPTMLPKRFRRASGSDFELTRGSGESYPSTTMETSYYSDNPANPNQAASPPMNHYRDSI